MTRGLPIRFSAIIFMMVACAPWLAAQDAARPKPDKLETRKPAEKGPVVEEEPPEEDPDLKPEVFSFDPLAAKSNIEKGDFYQKKGNTFAARRDYEWATRYDPTSKDAFLKLGDAELKLRHFPAAREAYAKFLTLAPDPKEADIVKKKMAKLPAENKANQASRTKLSDVNEAK